jgi:hypothetical protein
MMLKHGWLRHISSVLTGFLLLFAVGLVAAQSDTGTSGASVALTAFRHTHSLVRWIVVIVAIVFVIKLVMGIVQKTAWDKLTNTLMRVFSISTSIQWFIGLIFFVILGSLINWQFQAYHWIHLIVMTLALSASHMPAMFKKRPDTVRYQGTLALVIAALVLVIIGVIVLPQGWRIFPTA